jgi:hypothetical protein
MARITICLAVASTNRILACCTSLCQWAKVRTRLADTSLIADPTHSGFGVIAIIFLTANIPGDPPADSTPFDALSLYRILRKSDAGAAQQDGHHDEE